MKQLKSQLRLRFVLPLVIIAAAGLAVFQLGLVERLTGTNETAGAAQPSSAEEPSATTAPATTGAEEPVDGETTAEGEQSIEPRVTTKPTGAEQLAAELEERPVVVVVVYSPDGAVDSLAIAEARLGAEDAKAGFLALDASKERAIGEIATAYDIRSTPTVLVIRRGPTLANTIAGWADRQTVAQLAENARHAQ